jgi:hypothetical protein
MSYDKIVDSSALDASLTSVANAIRVKTGKTATMTLSEMSTEIEGISGGGDTTVEDSLVTRTVTEYTNDRVTKVGDYAFYGCSKLTSVDFPLVTSIGTYAFYGCSALPSADFPQATSIGTYAFCNCSALPSVSFPQATSIGNYAFRSCLKLTSADFPQATSVGNSAFSACSALTTADFPNATSIGNNAFQNCSSLTSADFPQATSLGGSAFYNCSKLTALVLRNTSNVCSLGSTGAFTNTPIKSGTGYIYVPDALVDSYKAATNWSTYAAQIKPLSEYTGG